MGWDNVRLWLVLAILSMIAIVALLIYMQSGGSGQELQEVLTLVPGSLGS